MEIPKVNYAATKLKKKTGNQYLEKHVHYKSRMQPKLGIDNIIFSVLFTY